MTGIRVVRAIAAQQIRLSVAQPFASLAVLAVPLTFLILFMLFALSGGRAPVAVYAPGHTASSQAMVAAVRDNPTFIEDSVPSAAAARQAITNSDALAAVTVPPQVSPHGTSVIGASIDNLNGDFADDIRRGLPMAVLQYYQANDARALPVTVDQATTYPSTTSFLDYIAVSVEVIALMLGGMIQGGMAMAAEWDTGTMKVVLLPGVPAWAVVTGKGLGAAAGTLASGACVLAVLLAIGIEPRAWGQFTAIMAGLTILFTALGLAIGSTLRSSRAILSTGIALGLPLFFISGAFGPVSWTTGAESLIAHIFPVLYANAAIQHATYGFMPLSNGWAVVIIMLAGWALLGMALSVLAHWRATARQ